MRLAVVSDRAFASIFQRSGVDARSVDITEGADDAHHVAAAAAALGHVVTATPLGGHPLRDLQRIIDGRPDLVVNLCDGVMGRPDLAPLVPAALDAAGVAYTGGDASSIGLCKRKHDVKAALVRDGLPTPQYQVVHQDDDVDTFTLHLVPPVLCKLAGEHASVGIDAGAVCFDEAAVRARLRYLRERFGQVVVVEEIVGGPGAGKELYVSCVGDPLSPLPLMEHTFDGVPDDVLRLRTFDGKWFERGPGKGGAIVDDKFRRPVPVRTPAAPCAWGIDDIEALAARALGVVGCRDWGRVDFRLDKGGIPMIIDVTPMTYLHPDAPCGKAAAAAGLSYVQLVGRIVDGALARAARTGGRRP